MYFYKQYSQLEIFTQTDLYFRPYRSGLDYCSEFDYLLYKGGLIDIATINIKFYLQKMFYLSIIVYIKVIKCLQMA